MNRAILKTQAVQFFLAFCYSIDRVNPFPRKNVGCGNWKTKVKWKILQKSSYIMEKRERTHSNTLGWFRKKSFWIFIDFRFSIFELKKLSLMLCWKVKTNCNFVNRGLASGFRGNRKPSSRSKDRESILFVEPP